MKYSYRITNPQIVIDKIRAIKGVRCSAPSAPGSAYPGSEYGLAESKAFVEGTGELIVTTRTASDELEKFLRASSLLFTRVILEADHSLAYTSHIVQLAELIKILVLDGQFDIAMRYLRTAKLDQPKA